MMPWEKLARAEVHPLRLTILEVFVSGGTHSAKRLSDSLGEALSNVSYHMKELRENGFLELVSRRPRRGAYESFYRLAENGADSSKQEDLP